FYVMPYVEGESLRDRLQRERQLPVADAVRVATEVASALDYAHRHGVIHRDIKPENILLHDGRALVADFGIALAMSRSEGGTRLTETGMSLGTPHYMSPEQAMGEREITARSDVYALGCVLYEMLTGEPPFVGPTAQAIVARVLTEEPRSLTLQRRTIPPHVEAAVQTALTKLPADRFGSAAEFSAALADPGYAAAGTAPRAAVTGARTVPPSSRRTVAAVGAFAILATALAAWGWLGRPARPPAPVTREHVQIAGLGTVPFQLSTSAAISPDGSALVYWDTVGLVPQLWVKERDQRDPAVLPGTAGATGGVTFSPDGEWIAFMAGPQLKKIPRRGGAAITLSDSAGGGWMPAWLDGGTIVFPGPGPAVLYRVSIEGGTTERLLDLSQTGGDGFARVAALPGGRGVLLSGVQANFAVGNVWVLDLRTLEPQLLVPGASWAEYSSTGHLIYVLRDGSLLAAPFDLDDHTLGQAVPLEDGIRTTAGVAEAALGMDGTLLYARATGTSTPVTPSWVDRAGTVGPVDPDFTLAGVPLNGGMRLSPDGTRLAFTAIGETGNVAQDIYVKRLPDGPAARITFEGTSNRRPTWSPDGTRLLFISNRGGKGDAVWAQRADGVGAATLLVEGDRAIFEAEWTPDGQWIVYRTDDDAGAGRGDILAIRPGTDTVPVTLVATPAEETGPAVSHDGHWLAYAADETGRKEIYVRPFPNTDDGKWLVSTNGGTEPAWAHSGRELFYRDGSGNMVAVSFTASGTTFEVRERRVMFPAQTYWANDDHRWYDVAPDDRRFILIDPGFSVASANLVRVGNLHSALRVR
ncbi:MAG: PD40 domain-containing protein, partial [Gemmatimonadales bacterium]|nr:PD40 domain-containing protein [Gemmatimonadales bacterium]